MDGLMRRQIMRMLVVLIGWISLAAVVTWNVALLIWPGWLMPVLDPVVVQESPQYVVCWWLDGGQGRVDPPWVIEGATGHDFAQAQALLLFFAVHGRIGAAYSLEVAVPGACTGGPGT